jgi:hypothetical protein
MDHAIITRKACSSRNRNASVCKDWVGMKRKDACVASMFPKTKSGERVWSR